MNSARRTIRQPAPLYLCNITNKMTTIKSAQTGTGRRLFRRILKILLIAHLLYLIPIGYSLASYYFTDDGTAWWERSRSRSSQAPDPLLVKDAVIQVYTARASRWRGALGVHTWIAVKPTSAEQFTRMEVFGFNLRRYGKAVSINQRSPDRYWFGNTPLLLRDIRGGHEVDDMIARLYKAAESYPYNDVYRLWPGPNSNTFIAWLAAAVPELRLELPVTAIGKDYLPGGALFARTPSDTGMQFSLGGVYGFLFAREEGIEVNLLGFSAGIDLSPSAIKLPGIGRIGNRDFKSLYPEIN